ncbi:von Willebrand factor A domain-containing protein 7 [Perognathus longimembris pacificus]|uniref:von Willebrand factor A domain-containing protein 7 n=1 Tax=Perognathus longimembris pacificus TaxID=214514 RepID=UPI00201969D9|nr:von Willebrand factor A domain-containing protein 7 [Perognathus longimembris pacificus]
MSQPCSPRKHPCLSGALQPSALLLLQLLLSPASAFLTNFWNLMAGPGSISHQHMTEEAALKVTLQLFLDHPIPGRPPLRPEDFSGKSLLIDHLFDAYYGPGYNSRSFRAALNELSRANAAQDFQQSTKDDPDLHFDAERLDQGHTRMREALQEALVAARAQDYTLARKRFGAALHALQDFYSHSNWVELGIEEPHPYLLGLTKTLWTVAPARAITCSDCSELSCPKNLLTVTLLTSGYFGTNPPKPPGKCSHGGRLDQSRTQPPRGGINKDSTSPTFSPHHMFHQQAANLALMSTVQAFNFLRSNLGDSSFSRLLNISPGSSLSFVLDTTGSMGEEISAAKIQTRRIVEQRRGTPIEPIHYILVPFHDPEFGPVFTTSDPDSFQQHLNELQALGGGDEPEMCLSALELALLHTPPLSDIFVFTDASPKDAFLTSRVESLTQERRCRVTFLVTEDPSRVLGRARREVLSPQRFEPYEAVARASGGEVIFTKDRYIRDVATVVGESTGTLVTLPLDPPVALPGRALVFHVDGLLHKLTVRLHGQIRSFSIRSPAGLSQGQEEGPGPLGHTRRFGQFWMVTVTDPPQAGTWEIQVAAEGAPWVRVQARSSVDFLFYFGIPVDDGPHPGFYPLTQPVAGLRTQLLVEVTGLDSHPRFSHAVLRKVPEGTELGRVALEPVGPPEQGLLTASLPPTLLSTSSPFSLQLIGRNGEGQDLQRAAPQPCTVAQVLVELSGPPSFLVPGSKVPLSLYISSFSGTQDLDIKTDVNPHFALTSNLTRAHLRLNESVSGRLWLEVPNSAAPRSIVTVTVAVMGVAGRGASPAPPTHAFLQLLVQDPAGQVRHPAFGHPGLARRHIHACASFRQAAGASLHSTASGKGRKRGGQLPVGERARAAAAILGLLGTQPLEEMRWIPVAHFPL